MSDCSERKERYPAKMCQWFLKQTKGLDLEKTPPSVVEWASSSPGASPIVPGGGACGEENASAGEGAPPQPHLGFYSYLCPHQRQTGRAF